MELWEAPLCKYCDENWRFAENLAEHSAAPPSLEEEGGFEDPTVNLKRKRSAHQRQISVSDDGSADTINVVDDPQILQPGQHDSGPDHGTEQPAKLGRPVAECRTLLEVQKASETVQVETTKDRKPIIDRNSIMRPTHVSIFRPLDLNNSYSPRKSRPLPKWMTMLPSNQKERTPQTPKWMAHLPSNRAASGQASRHSSSPANLPSQLQYNLPSPSRTRDIACDPKHVQMPSIISLTSPGCTSPPDRSSTAATSDVIDFNHPTRSFTTPLPRTGSSPFPYFQNPRAPLTPAAESTWSCNTPSPGLAPYTGLQYTSVPTKATFGYRQGMPSSRRSTQSREPVMDGTSLRQEPHQADSTPVSPTDTLPPRNNSTAAQSQIDSPFSQPNPSRTEQYS